jgi:hypothetical protein
VSQRAQRAPVRERPNNSEACGVLSGYTGTHRHVVEREVRRVARCAGDRSASE